nr:MAG TPA: hypothetical protein [Caudoviricetes sp.]
MKYTAIIIASAAVAFCVQAYAKAQAYMDYTTASAIGVDAIDPYENIRDDIARHEMQEAARITREREVEIAQMYEQLNAGERMRGDAEATK